VTTTESAVMQVSALDVVETSQRCARKRKDQDCVAVGNFDPAQGTRAALPQVFDSNRLFCSYKKTGARGEEDQQQEWKSVIRA